MARAKKAANGKEPLSFDQKLWAAADKMRGHMDPAEYKHGGSLGGRVHEMFLSVGRERLVCPRDESSMRLPWLEQPLCLIDGEAAYILNGVACRQQRPGQTQRQQLT